MPDLVLKHSKQYTMMVPRERRALMQINAANIAPGQILPAIFIRRIVGYFAESR